ncbi:MAG: nucleoside triphosphate pyrophosphatase [Pseudomonadota bacterium]
MQNQLVLASGSSVRATLLRNAGLSLTVKPARVDETSIKAALLAEKASPRDIADALAEMKARKVSDSFWDQFVIGCDQVLDFQGTMISKARDKGEALAILRSMQNQKHTLFSAVVIYFEGQPVWRHIGQARLHMRPSSDSYLNSYLERNWHSVQDAVGCYKLEEEGVRLFRKVEGDYFHVLGLPLLEILDYLAIRGVIEQ